MSNVIADHTRLTTSGFVGFTGSMFALGMLNVVFGAIDLAMVAPFGVEQVSAVGLGDAVVVLVLAFCAGIVDIFTSRLAVAEGNGTTAIRLPVLVLALALILGVVQVVAIVISVCMAPLLDIFGQPDTVIPLASGYTTARLGCGVVATLATTVTLEILKVVGLRNWSVTTLCIGLVLNVGFNWLMLYSTLAALFPSPAAAVAWSTVVTQACMAVFGVLFLARFLRARETRVEIPSWDSVRREAISIGATGSGVGIRHLNDYVGYTIPFLLMGTLGVQTLAAVTVAARVWTLYCRVPQACFTSSFIFYNYAIDRSYSESREVQRRVLRMSAWPTFAAAVLVLGLSPFIVLLLAGSDADHVLAVSLVYAFFIGLIPYFLAGFYGELLTAHQAGAFFSISSSVVTYAFVLPFAVVGVFVFHSAFFAIASTAVASLILAVLFKVRYQRIVRNLEGSPA